jgi:Flp pilus assembly pilin Flp
MKLIKMLKGFVKDERGIETSEYAIMLVLIAIALIVAITYLKDAIAKAFQDTANTIDNRPT